MAIKYCADIQEWASTQMWNDRNMQNVAAWLWTTGATTSNPYRRLCSIGAWQNFFQVAGFSSAVFSNTSTQEVESAHPLVFNNGFFFFELNNETLTLIPIDSNFLIGAKFVSHMSSTYTHFVSKEEGAQEIKCINYGGEGEITLWGIDEINLSYENTKAYLKQNTQWFPSFLKASESYINSNTAYVNTRNDAQITGIEGLCQTDMPNFLVQNKSIRGVYNTLFPLTSDKQYNQVLQSNPNTSATINNPNSGRIFKEKKSLGYTRAVFPVYSNYGTIGGKTCRSYGIVGNTLLVSYTDGSTSSYVLNDKTTLVRYKRTTSFNDLTWNSADVNFQFGSRYFIMHFWSGIKTPIATATVSPHFTININCTCETHYWNTNTQGWYPTTDGTYTCMWKDVPSKTKTYSGSTDGDWWRTSAQSATTIEIWVGNIYQNNADYSGLPTTWYTTFTLNNYKEISGFTTNFSGTNLNISNRVPVYKHQGTNPNHTYWDWRELYQEEYYYNSNSNDFTKLEITNSSTIPPGLIPQQTYYPLLEGKWARSILSLYTGGITSQVINTISGDYSYDSTNKIFDVRNYSISSEAYQQIAEEYNNKVSRQSLRISDGVYGSGIFDSLYFPIDTFYLNFSGASTDPLTVLWIFTETYIEEQ